MFLEEIFRTDGSIKIYAQKNSIKYTNQYTMNSLIWIRNNLPRWSKLQKESKRFFKILAEKYSKRFLKVSDNTIERLCYLVDSGAADKWFEKYEMMKSKQITLDE